jgi:hypothetical protein
VGRGVFWPIPFGVKTLKKGSGEDKRGRRSEIKGRKRKDERNLENKRIKQMLNAGELLQKGAFGKIIVENTKWRGAGVI